MSKYNINDLVMHSREGLSKIFSIITMGDKEYYLVHSIRGSGDNIYVPVERADGIIRNIMSEKEADELLKFMKTIEKDFNTNTKQRRDNFKRRLNSGDIHDIAYLCCQLYFYNDLDHETDEYKLGAMDLDMLNFADTYLNDELMLSYNVSADNIHDFILKRIKKL